jgi:GGDEF domain-containing protein
MLSWTTDPARARRTILVGGVLLLAILAVIAYARGVDRIEVLAGLLFIPVFLSFSSRGVAGGLVGGVLAGLAYVALRLPAIRTTGLEQLLDVVAIRCASYLAFGVVGGWAMQQVDASLQKLRRVDRVDDATGLHTARFLVEQTDLERSRAQRYGSRFSVLVIDIAAEALTALDARTRASALHHLGEMIAEAVRQVDRGIHAFDGQAHRLAVVLPETDAEGAAVLADRLAQRISRSLVQQGAAVRDGQVAWQTVSFPGQERQLDALREEFAALDPRMAGAAGRAPANPESA